MGRAASQAMLHGVPGKYRLGFTTLFEGLKDTSSAVQAIFYSNETFPEVLVKYIFLLYFRFDFP